MMNTNTPYNANGAESPPASPNIREEASAPSPSTAHAPSPTVHAPSSTEANGNNSSAANILPIDHNKATVAPRALSNDESIELRKLLKATLNINDATARMSIATEEQDEEDASVLLEYAMNLVEDGESVGHISGELLLLELPVFDASTVDDFEECLAIFLRLLDTSAAPRPSTVHAPPPNGTNNSSEANGNNPPSAYVTPAAPNPTLSTSNANEGGNTQDKGLEFIDDHGPPLPIGTIEAQLDEAEANGKAFARPSGQLEQIQDDEGPHHASATLAASLEATNKSPARRHVEIINDNAAPINPFDSTAGEFVKPSGKLEQIMDDEGPSDNSFAVLAASLEATDKGADKRHVETMNDDAAPTPFSSTEFDDIQTDKIKAKTQTMDNHGHGEEPTSIGSSLDVIEGEDDIETGANPGAGEGGVRITPPVNPTHRGDNNDDVVNKDDEEESVDHVTTSNSILEALVTNRESQSDGIHVAEAYAVEGSDQEVVVATHLEPTSPALPWWKQRRFKLFLTTMFVVVAALAIALGVSMSSSSAGGEPMTSSPGGETVVIVVERTDTPSKSLVPTSLPSVSLRPSVHPSLPPTMTPSPTFARLESLKIVADDGAAEDYFGSSVAIFGDILVVGAVGDDDKGNDSGSVHIYNRDLQTKEWIFQQKLVPDDGAAVDQFGSSVAIYDNTVVVGAIGDDDKGDRSGSAYIYRQDTETKELILQQKIVADDGAASAFFGKSVAIYNNTVVVGAPGGINTNDYSGSAYIYHQDPETKEWIFEQKLVPDDGAANDLFGWIVAIYDNTIIVGAQYDDDKGDFSGSAYIYHQDPEAKEWIFQQKLVADDGAAYDLFGYSVAIYGNTLVVGASFGVDDKGDASGSAYIYHQVPETKEWILQQRLVPDDGAVGDEFGGSVAIYEDTLVVGAIYDDEKGDNSGSTHIYYQDPETKEWILHQKLVADDGAFGDRFGYSAAIYNGTVVVGAIYDDDKGTGSGSVYVYSSSYTRALSPVPSSSLAPSITMNPSAMPTQSSMPSTSSSPTGTCYNVTIAVVYDEYPSETSWEIVNIGSNGSEGVVKSYEELDQEATSHAEDVCLPEGEYGFVILDSCGDGFCCKYGDGHYNVTTLDGEMIAQGGAFGDEDRTRFSIPFTPVQPSPT